MEEKSAQVMLMGSIYEGAKCVLVWLGLGNPEDYYAVREAFKDFRRIYRLHRLVELRRRGYTVRNGIITRKFRRALYRSQLPLLDRFIPSNGGERFKLWQSFMDVPYFERIWTLQETALAKRSILIYGPYSVDLEAAEFAFVFMTPYSREMESEFSQREYYNIRQTGFKAHDHARAVYRYSKRAKSKDLGYLRLAWEHMWSAIAELHVTVPHDRLYGIYGLLQRCHLDDLPLPDYSKSMDAVWLDGTWAIMQVVQTLDVINDVINDGECNDHRIRLHCEPSCYEKEARLAELKHPRWTRQFDVHWSMGWLSTLHLVDRLPKGTSWDRKPTRICHISGPMDTDHYRNMLLLRGCVVDRVQKTSRLLQQCSLAGTMDATEYMLRTTGRLADWIRYLRARFQGRDYLPGLYELLMWNCNDIVLFGPAYDQKRDQYALFKEWHGHMLTFGEGELDLACMTEPTEPLDPTAAALVSAMFAAMEEELLDALKESPADTPENITDGHNVAPDGQSTPPEGPRKALHDLKEPMDDAKESAHSLTTSLGSTAEPYVTQSGTSCTSTELQNGSPKPSDKSKLSTADKYRALLGVGAPTYHSQICVFMRKRQLFTTNHCNLGASSHCVKEGDLVVLLCWARLPAILRPVEVHGSPERKTYLLVGFACIPGLNDCNKWDMREELLEEFALI